MYSLLFTRIVLLVFCAAKARVTGVVGKGIGGYIWGLGVAYDSLLHQAKVETKRIEQACQDKDLA
jgi:hypothetical protein